MSEALDKLIEAVEAGETPSSRRFRAAWPDLNQGGLNAQRAARGSIDAALALHKALLPSQWSCILTVLPRAGAADLHWRGNMEPAFTGISANPARAWLIAILRAYRAAQREA